MEIMSPSPASGELSSTLDEFSMQQSLLFTESLKDLKNLRSQLYSAAEYFELSYTKDDQKQTVVGNLKDYAVKALVNTVDHLGSVSYKVNDILDQKVDEVSRTDVRVSCIEQRLRMCQEVIDCAGFSQQSLVIMTPKYHKRYILPAGESIPESGKLSVAHNPDVHLKEDSESKLFQDAVRSTIRDRRPSFIKTRSPSPSQRGRSCSPSQRARSSSPSRKTRSPSPSPRQKFSFPERRSGATIDRRSTSPVPNSNLNPLLRSGSLISRHGSFKYPSITRMYPTEAQKSSSMRLHAEREDEKMDPNLSKSKRLLKALLSRRKTRKDEMLYTYIDEY